MESILGYEGSRIDEEPPLDTTQTLTGEVWTQIGIMSKDYKEYFD